jgi:hypothetical protein
MIKGDKIYLTELDRTNSETIRTWLNDPEVRAPTRARAIPQDRFRRNGA